MNCFTEAFRVLDYGDKGYILINDFKTEMQKYIHNDDGNVSIASEQTLNKLLSLLKPSTDDKVYFQDFVSAIRELEFYTNQQTSLAEDKVGIDYSQNSDFSPFINDGDSYSTGDSGFDNEYRVCQDFSLGVNTGVGKQNRKLIKKVQQIDTIHNKDIVSPRGYLYEVNNADNRDSKYTIEDFNLPLDEMSSSFNGRRRQRSFAASDFVTCGSRKVTNRKKHNMEDDDAHSLNCWAPCSGSAADLFYHDSMTDIQNTLQKLERSMENLQNITSESKYSKHNKRSDGNYFLAAQVQTLEEKLRESQKQFERDLHMEREISRKNIGRIEKSKLEEIEYLKWSLTSKEEDLESMKKELNAVMTENEKLKYDKLRTEDKLIDLQQQMTYIEAEMKRLKDFHGRELNVLISERNTLFARTMDHDETDANKGGKQVEMSRLISENSELKRRLEECEAEFLALSVQQGQNVLQITSSDNSWIQEIDSYTKDEVIDLLVKEKDGNFRLREYVNRILTRIIEKDPSLLEI